MSDAAVERRVGLLFVHGIGEQKRFQHLLESAADLAELMLQANEGSTISTDDRTLGWKLPAGIVDPDGATPLTMTLTTSNGNRTVFACREVWWADLGARSGLADTIAFWLWALGQWGAPIYRLLDAAQTSDDPRDEPPITELPLSVVGTAVEFWARIKLALAALCAAMTALSWVLVKRVFSKLFGTAPSPTLIVQYVGDVHTYEERAAPGATNLSDPGFPRRVAIRRRMITEMVATATGKVDCWYVVAHSLGTVLAYNGLTEIGHTLPNYLPQHQWDALPDTYKRDDNCRRRRDAEIAEMMPARPSWLRPWHVLNRELLFSNLRGILTYGSPLDKFAALWPRIVATATDRKDRLSAFHPDCVWINYFAPEDAVAAHLDYFTAAPFGNAVPPVDNRRKPPSWRVGLAHILYFSGIERFKKGFVDEQKREIAGWLTGKAAAIRSSDKRGPIVPFAYTALIVGMWAFSSIMVALVGGLLKALLGASAAISFKSVGDFAQATWSVAPDFVGYLLTVVLLAGLFRWYRESDLNGKLLATDPTMVKASAADPAGGWKAKVAGVAARQLAALRRHHVDRPDGQLQELDPARASAPPIDPTAGRKKKVADVIARQKRIALISLAFGSVILVYGVLADTGFLAAWDPWWWLGGNFSGLIGATAAIAAAAAAQTLSNRPTKTVERLGGVDRTPERPKGGKAK